MLVRPLGREVHTAIAREDEEEEVEEEPSGYNGFVVRAWVAERDDFLDSDHDFLFSAGGWDRGASERRRSSGAARGCIEGCRLKGKPALVGREA